MTQTTTGQQLYPATRLNGMSDDALDRVMRFALADRAETSTTVYDGMTRHETILTAQRTIDDVAAEQGCRAVAEITRVHDVKQAYALANAEQSDKLALLSSDAYDHLFDA